MFLWLVAKYQLHNYKYDKLSIDTGNASLGKDFYWSNNAILALPHNVKFISSLNHNTVKVYKVSMYTWDFNVKHVLHWLIVYID